MSFTSTSPRPHHVELHTKPHAKSNLEPYTWLARHNHQFQRRCLTTQALQNLSLAVIPMWEIPTGNELGALGFGSGYGSWYRQTRCHYSEGAVLFKLWAEAYSPSPLAILHLSPAYLLISGVYLCFHLRLFPSLFRVLVCLCLRLLRSLSRCNQV